MMMQFLIQNVMNSIVKMGQFLIIIIKIQRFVLMNANLIGKQIQPGRTVQILGALGMLMKNAFMKPCQKKV